jgi:hypothetical protein
MLAASLAMWAFWLGSGISGTDPGRVSHGQSPASQLPETWTKLHEALARRTLKSGQVVGLDEPELLLWPSSGYLIEEGRMHEICSALEAFAAAGSRGPEVDVRARVLLQQELWAAFDWGVAWPPHPFQKDAAPVGELASKLAAVIAISAPSSCELDGLTDNLAAAEAAGLVPLAANPDDPKAPFLPPGLSAEDGGWVYVADPGGKDLLATQHSDAHGGRASFDVAVRVPGGREATLGWLGSLGTVAACDGAQCSASVDPLGGGPVARPTHYHLPTSAIPAGTHFALVQRALAFDDRGELRRTPLVQRVLLRAFHTIPQLDEPIHVRMPNDWPWQSNAELVLRPSLLLAGKRGGLVPIERGETAFSLLSARSLLEGSVDEVDHHVDLSRHKHLDTCHSCHHETGLASVNSYTGTIAASWSYVFSGFEVFGLSAPPRELVPAPDEQRARSAVEFKRNRSDWSALQALAFAGR